MKTIIVPTDFSKCANNAMTYALEIAARTGASVHVVHIVFPNQGVENNVYNAFWIDDYIETRRLELDKWMLKFKKNPSFKKLHLKASCEVGFPVPSVCEFAGDAKADLIVMGTTGATGLERVFLGSVASGVISKTKIPVLLVPKKGSYRVSANLVYATDFKLNIDAHSKRVLEEIVKVHQSGLKIVNIVEQSSKADKAQEKALAGKLGDISHEFHYLHDEDAPQAISNYIEAVDANLLITVAHSHGLLHRLFYESVTKKLAYHIDIPMLVLHD